MGGDRHVLGLEAEPQGRAGEQLGHHLQQVLRRPVAREAGVDLDLGLLDVPEVGDEFAPLGGDQRQAVAAGVAGQVADVRRSGDEQGVDPGGGQAAGELVRPGAHPARSRARMSSASP